MRWTFVTGVLLLGLLALPTWADEGSEQEDVKLLGSRFVRARASWKDIDAWYAQKLAAMELEDGGDVDNPSPELKLARRKLALVARKLGVEQALSYTIGPKRARADVGDTRGLVRFDLDPPHTGLISMKRKLALLQGLALTTRSQPPKPPKIIFEIDDDVEKKMLFSIKCTFYRLTGGIRGEVWVGWPDEKRLPAVREFFERSRSQVGGWPGELLHVIAQETSGIPVLAKVSGVRGPSLSGVSRGGDEIYCFHTMDAAVVEDHTFKVPLGFKTRRLGLPKK